MSLAARALAVVLLALLGVTLDAARAFADPPALDARDAERAFAVGDLEVRKGEPIEETDPVAQAIAWVRDRAFRPRAELTGAAPPVAPPDDAVRAEAAYLVRASLATRAAAISRGRATPPDEAVPAAVPLKVLSALVLDRIRREREGRHSTSKEGPLAGVGGDEAIAYFLEQWVPGAYGGPGEVSGRDVEAERRQARTLRDLSQRNAVLGLVSVLGLIGMAAVGGLVLGRRRRPAVAEPTATPPADTGGGPEPSS